MGECHSCRCRQMHVSRKSVISEQKTLATCWHRHQHRLCSRSPAGGCKLIGSAYHHLDIWMRRTIYELCNGCPRAACASTQMESNAAHICHFLIPAGADRNRQIAVFGLLKCTRLINESSTKYWKSKHDFGTRFPWLRAMWDFSFYFFWFVALC